MDVAPSLERLRLRTARLELRLPAGAEVIELSGVAAGACTP
jgi:hypothetical protein